MAKCLTALFWQAWRASAALCVVSDIVNEKFTSRLPLSFLRYKLLYQFMMRRKPPRAARHNWNLLILIYTSQSLLCIDHGICPDISLALRSRHQMKPLTLTTLRREHRKEKLLKKDCTLNCLCSVLYLKVHDWARILFFFPHKPHGS
jgi:hypothetical protein